MKRHGMQNVTHYVDIDIRLSSLKGTDRNCVSDLNEMADYSTPRADKNIVISQTGPKFQDHDRDRKVDIFNYLHKSR